MFSQIKKFFFLFFISTNLFGELSFSTVTQLSDNHNVGHPQIASYEKNVYAIWEEYDGSFFRIRTAYSNDNGETWNNPISTPTADGTPYLSPQGILSDLPKIAACGQYVYAIWERGAYPSTRLIQTAYSDDGGAHWYYPDSTPTGTTSPTLSPSGFSEYSNIACSGEYVSAVWCTDTAGHYLAQTAYSEDHGQTWHYPDSTPIGTDTPILSSYNAQDSAIAAYGEYIYATWDFDDTLIQTAYSDDHGQNWYYPDSTPTGTTTPNLSTSGGADFPQIAAYGEYAYAVWEKSDGTGHEKIQTAYTADHGQTWHYSNSTPADTGTPDLSNSGESAQVCDIAAYGEYAHSIWCRSNGTIDIVQVAYTANHGQDWFYPTSTPTGSTPNISPLTEDTRLPCISAYQGNAYAAWMEYGNETQVAYSNDHGVTWEYPEITPPGTTTPIISNSGNEPAIASYGHYTYVIWRESDGIYVSAGKGFSVSYKKIIKNLLLQIDNTNHLFWNPVSNAIAYKVYYNSLSNLVYEGNHTSYYHHGSKTPDLYYVTYINNMGIESDPVEVFIE